MTTISTKVRVRSDGNVVVPVGTEQAGREVTVTISPSPPTLSPEQWREFIDRTAGSIDDPTFRRHDPGEYENREGF